MKRCARTAAGACALAVLLAAAGTASAGCLQQARELIKSRQAASALALCRKQAQAGDVESAYGYGLLLEKGIGTRRDPLSAARWLKQAAESGNIDAQPVLAALYLDGRGIPRDFMRARRWARRAAEAGRPQGQYLLYRADIQSPELRPVTNGKFDAAKYAKLAARPAGERVLDIEGYAALAAAAERLPAARIVLGAFLLDLPGEDNRNAGVRLLAGFPKLSPKLAKYRQAAQELSRLGHTHLSVKLYLDTRRAAWLAAGFRAGRISGRPELMKDGGCSVDSIKLAATAIQRDIEGAEYLPIPAPILAKSYLIKGRWREQWTFDACGTRVFLPIAFEADGLGGARYTIEPHG